MTTVGQYTEPIEHKLKVHNYRNQFPNAIKAAAIEDWVSGVPLVKIMRKYGVHMATVSIWITKHYLPKRQDKNTIVITIKSKV